jgi:hypothetical protein
MPLQAEDKRNIHTLSANIKFICTRSEMGLKCHPVALVKLSVHTHHLSLFRVPWRLIFIFFSVLNIAEKLLAQGVKQQSITHSLEIIICICLINLLQEQNMAKCYN